MDGEVEQVLYRPVRDLAVLDDVGDDLAIGVEIRSSGRYGMPYQRTAAPPPERSADLPLRGQLISTRAAHPIPTGRGTPDDP